MSKQTKPPRWTAHDPDVPKPKTLTLRLAVTDRDLRAEVMRAFDLAKSAGRELNANFTLGTAELTP